MVIINFVVPSTCTQTLLRSVVEYLDPTQKCDRLDSRSVGLLRRLAYGIIYPIKPTASVLQ